ncbi:glycosyltransferase family 2 protein [Algoriphagus formosus]|uniref:glycosyltransferase family 2 protein n=1 Tax=Algoriphagus formosus TaxID=2007308 RepID=UPI003F7233A7
MSSSHPVVSVCCITFNHADFIGKALDSFLNQKTSFPFEILVYDDDSNDGTKEILKQYELDYPHIIRVFYSVENQYSQGVRLLNLRFNLPRARGKYIATCDGDDYWTDLLKLQKQVDFLEEHPEVVLCFHGFDRLENQKLVDSSLYSHLKNSSYTIFDQKEFLQMHVQFLTIMFRQNVKFPMISSEINGDVFVLTHLSEVGKCAYLDFKGAVYRYHQNGVFRKMSRIRQINSSIETRKIISNQVKPHTRKFLYKRISSFYKSLFKESLRVKNYSLGIKALLGVVYYNLKYVL